MGVQPERRVEARVPEVEMAFACGGHSPSTPTPPSLRGRTLWRQASSLIQYVHFISADFLQTWFKDLGSIPLVYICRGPFVKLIRKWAFACGVGGGVGPNRI